MVSSGLDIARWQIAAIQDGVSAADRGELVEHDEALKMLQGWGIKQGPTRT